MAKRLTKEELQRRGEEIHQDENGNPLYGYDEVVYIDANTKVKLWCKRCQKYFWQTPGSHLYGRGCPDCGKRKKAEKKKMTFEEFKRRGEEKHHDENGKPLYGYDEVIYINCETKVKLYCYQCQKYFWQTPSIHLSGHGCPDCGDKRTRNSHRKNTEIFIKQGQEKHKDVDGKPLYGYDKVEYKGCFEKVWIYCYHCQKYFLQTPADHLSGYGCPYCKISKGEKNIAAWLNKNNYKLYEDFLYQYRNDWLENLTLDFYLPKLQIGIEFDGRQHFEPIERWGGEEGFQKVQERDRRKNILCEKNGIKLIRISYTDFDRIDEILEENLLDKKLKINYDT